jgi:hypothetical protein
MGRSKRTTSPPELPDHVKAVAEKAVAEFNEDAGRAEQLESAMGAVLGPFRGRRPYVDQLVACAFIIGWYGGQGKAQADGDVGRAMQEFNIHDADELRRRMLMLKSHLPAGFR